MDDEQSSAVLKEFRLERGQAQCERGPTVGYETRDAGAHGGTQEERYDSVDDTEFEEDVAFEATAPQAG